MTTTATKTCLTCNQRNAQVVAAEQAVATIARRLAHGDNLRPHQQRGFLTQLAKAKAGLVTAREARDLHVYGECGE